MRNSTVPGTVVSATKYQLAEPDTFPKKVALPSCNTKFSWST